MFFCMNNVNVCKYSLFIHNYYIIRAVFVLEY